MIEPQQKRQLQLKDFINISILEGHMLWILITSGAEGKLSNIGFDTGQGKSTLGLQFVNSQVYAGNWERTKANCIGTYWELKPILDRPDVTLGVFFDDIHLTLGKDKQHNPEIRELAYYMTTVRPYVRVIIATASHRDHIQKDFREMFHFEVICAKRGLYEVQQVKKWLDFDRPSKIREGMRYKGEGLFAKLPPDIEEWYVNWRDKKNREIREKLGAFKGLESKDLTFGNVSVIEKELLDNIIVKGFIGYEWLLEKGLSATALRLKRKGWLELDSKRRYQLTVQAEEVLLK